jgi:hypothetical protein
MFRIARLLMMLGALFWPFLAVHASVMETPGCSGATPTECVVKALNAMGGPRKLESIRSLQLAVISHTALMEQSYRQEPFITAYKRSKTTIDFYFPEHRLLYASDTLVVNPDNTLYVPELMHEVQQAVEREHLNVDTVYAMHRSPIRWNEVISLLEKSS